MINMYHNIIVEEKKLDNLIEYFRQQSFAIVQFQRRFVWNRKKVCKLCDSILNQYPIGSILIWKTPYSKHKHIRTQVGTIPEFNPDRNTNILFILDGQQRLTTLYNIMEGKKINNYYHVEIDFKKICLNLQTNEDIQFDYCEEDENHLSLCNILKTKLDKEHKKLISKKFSKRRVKKINDCCETFYNYIFAFITIPTRHYEHINEAFIRVNSAGTPLSTADRLMSMITTFSFRHDIEHLKAQLKPEDFISIKDENIIQAIILILGSKSFTGLTRDKLIRQINDTESDEHKNYKENIDKIKKAIKKSVDYLVTTIGVRSFNLLPFPLMIPVLSVFFYNNDNENPLPKQHKEIKKWFWKTAITPQSYSGGGYTKNVMADTKFMKKLVQKNIKYSGNGYEKLNIKEFISAYTKGKSGLIKAFFCLLSIKEPRYLENGTPISLDKVSDPSNKKNIHHVFPKALLRRNGFDQKEYNNLVNFCFLPFSLNRDFEDEKPKDYLSDYKKKRHFKTVMKSHILPHKKSSNIWSSNIKKAYKRFLEERAYLIAKEFNKESGEDLFKFR